MPRKNTAVLIDSGDRLTPWWRIGAAFNRTQEDVYAATREDAYERLRDLAAREDITELHVWGHGAKGQPLLGGEPLSIYKIKSAMPELELVWWRSCSVHMGVRGYNFARLVTSFGITSVGHARATGLWQPSICALRPGERPWWDLNGNDLRGVSMLRMTVPEFAYEENSPS